MNRLPTGKRHQAKKACPGWRLGKRSRRTMAERGE